MPITSRFGYFIKILKSQKACQKVEKYLVVMFIKTCHQFSSLSDANFEDALLLYGLRCSSWVSPLVPVKTALFCTALGLL